jgi:type I restriction enzyme, S subunit
MPSEWQALTLAEAGVTLIDCEHRTPPDAGAGYPYIAIPQLKEGHIELKGARRISQEDFDDWTKKLAPQEHDVIVVRRCNSGLSAVVPRGLKCAIGQNLVILRTDGKRIRPEFLRWLVRGDEWWEQVRKYMNVGAVFDSLKCRDIPGFKVLVAPIEEQHRICDVLDPLDHRIDLLRQANLTLESIAQALFKSWFIDFDPVRAKAEGREPEAMDAATAALYPAEFEESALGLIPKGWRTGSILDLASLLSGGTPNTTRPEYWGGDVAWASAKDVSQSPSIALLSTERSITNAGLNGSATRLIPAMATVIVARGATTGRMVFVGREMAMNQTCYALVSKIETPAALFCLLRNQIAALLNAAHGSVFDTITTSTFAGSLVVLPPNALLREFEQRSAPLFERIVEATSTIETLAELRDTLLPRLVSGKLRFAGTQPQLEEAVA